MSLKNLQKALKGAKKDEFEDGTVIRWTSGGRYTYAALKTPVGWFTTARVMPETFQRVPQVVTFEGLLTILRKSENSKVEIATAWQAV